MLIKWVDIESDLLQLLPKRLRQCKQAVCSDLGKSDFFLYFFFPLFLGGYYTASHSHSYT